MENKKLTENKSKGEKMKLPCKNCQNETWHEIMASIDNHTSEEIDDTMVFESLGIYQILKCLGCDDISFRYDYTDDSMQSYDPDDGKNWTQHTIEIYPNRIVGRKILKNIHVYPFMIQQIYLETHSAICSKQPILAGIGIRALVESICKEKEAIGRDLKMKIDNLVEKGILSKQGSEILQHVRALGNEAAHEAKPHSEDTLGMAMDVVEHLLQGVYLFRSLTRKNDDLPF